MLLKSLLSLLISVNFYNNENISSVGETTMLKPIIDTTLVFNSYRELHNYWINQNILINQKAKEIPKNYLDQKREKFYRDSMILFEQDLYTLLMFKNLKRFKKEKELIYILKFNIAFSNLVPISDRIKIFESFPHQVKSSADGKKIFKELLAFEDNLNSSKKVFEFRSISVTDVHGSTISIDKLFKNNKQYYLLILGASWCGPCRQENRFLNKEIQKIDTTKIQIIGLSIDDNKNAWLSALQKDQCKWENFLLYDGTKSTFYIKATSSGVPYNLLLNTKKELISSHNSLQLILNKLPTYIYPLQVNTSK